MPCSPGMRRCGPSCLHRLMVEDYRAARERDEAKRDEETIGYPTENANYAREHDMVTFKRWLTSIAGQGIYSPPAPDEGEPAPWDDDNEGDWT